MNGIITDLQRFSLNDGPGIRTTIFFKGCNMHCAWCHNPETFSLNNELIVTESKCIGCLNCVSACPTGARKISGNTLHFNRTECTACGRCAEVCFPEALVNSAKKVDIDFLMREIIQDKPYYDDSNGGITISGGEVMCQKEFTEALIDSCRKENISCAVETNLEYDFKKVESLLKKLDTIMFDLKLANPIKHKKWTGVDNVRILKNVQLLDSLDIPLICRTPLVPGATDAPENLRAILKILEPLKNLQYWELLNFNPLGNSKYKGLQLTNPFLKEKPFCEAKLEAIRSELGKSKVEIKIS